ncbi:MAG: lecithin retinol acyltransferase family protein [Treponema sp.]|nr:lecithin retinol acyltransferase family protein [Treponema sp.]MBR1403375.1 lecithin retinol acyltransferase family protein [Treponema sp.]
MRSIVRFILKILVTILYKPKITFTDKKVQSRRLKSPCVIIANHTHFFDPILLETVFRGKITSVVAKDWYENKKLHWFLKFAQCIPCDRYHLDTEWFLLAKKAIDKGHSIVIFPEGRCNEDGRISEFKSGYAFLARTYKIPVLCVGLSGIFSVFHRTRMIIDVPEKVERIKGIPSAEDLEQKNEYFRQKIIGLKNRTLKETVENETPNKGDIVSVNRGSYRHFGIYVGENQVVHFSADSGRELDPETAVVRQTSVEEFLEGAPLEIQKPLNRKSFSAKSTIRRAKSQVGEMKGQYNIAWNNCEHFAMWCKYGVKKSRQVKTVSRNVLMSSCAALAALDLIKNIFF